MAGSESSLVRSFFKGNVLVIVGIILIGFGLINITFSAFAQEEAAVEETSTSNQTSTSNDILDKVVDRVILELGPLVAGAVTIAIQFARKQGYKISAEAEALFVNSAKSFVTNQSRAIYNDIRDNPSYLEDLKRGRLPPELGKKAKERVMYQMKVGLQSDRFTKTARKLLDDNLDILIERSVTESKSEMVQKGRELLKEMVPIAVDAALLGVEKNKEVKKEKLEGIMEKALRSVKRSLDLDKVLFDDDDAMMRIKSELSKKIVKVEVK